MKLFSSPPSVFIFIYFFAIFQHWLAMAADIFTQPPDHKKASCSLDLRKFHIFESQNPTIKKFALELVNFRKMFLRKLEIQPHFLCLRRK